MVEAWGQFAWKESTPTSGNAASSSNQVASGNYEDGYAQKDPAEKGKGHRRLSEEEGGGR